MRKLTLPTPYMVGDVHVYTAEVNGELVLFDTGPPTEAARDILRRELDLKRVRHVFVTHCHVDHYGLSRFLSEHTEAEIHLPRLDAVKIERHPERLERVAALLASLEFEEELIEGVRLSVQRTGVFPDFPERYRVVEESGAAESLGIRVLACPGHSQSDLVYLCGDCAVTGDTLLRDIFQAPLLDVDLTDFSKRFSNYHAYCSTLCTLKELRGMHICPGHRNFVVGMEETVLFYVRKLIERALHVAAFPAELSVREVLRRLFGKTAADPFLLYLKASEVLFMRDFLAEPGRLRQALESLGLFEDVRPVFDRVA